MKCYEYVMNMSLNNFNLRAKTLAKNCTKVIRYLGGNAANLSYYDSTCLLQMFDG